MSSNGHKVLAPGSEEWSIAHHNLGVEEERLRRLLVLRDRLPPEIMRTERRVLALRVVLGQASPEAVTVALHRHHPTPMGYGVAREIVWKALDTPATIEELRCRCPMLGDGQIQGALAALRASNPPRVVKEARRGAPYRRNAGASPP